LVYPGMSCPSLDSAYCGEYFRMMDRVLECNKEDEAWINIVH